MDKNVADIMKQDIKEWYKLLTVIVAFGVPTIILIALLNVISISPYILGGISIEGGCAVISIISALLAMTVVLVKMIIGRHLISNETCEDIWINLIINAIIFGIMAWHFVVWVFIVIIVLQVFLMYSTSLRNRLEEKKLTITLEAVI